MKIIKTTVILLVLVSVVGLLFGCGGNSDEDSNETSVYTVGRGDLQLDISAAGNLDPVPGNLSRNRELVIGHRLWVAGF